MLLAALYVNHHDELLADCFQTYGLDIRGLESGSLDPDFLAPLVAQLPRGSRVWEALKLDAWDLNTWILNNIAHSLSCYLYSMTDDAKHGINKPKPLLPLFNKKQSDDMFGDLAPQTVDIMNMIAEFQLKGVM